MATQRPGGSLRVVGTATNQLLPDCAPPLLAHGFATLAVAVAITPDGQRAHVSVVTSSFDAFGLSAGGEIQVVDLTTNQVTSTIPLCSPPGVVVFTADGRRAYATITSYRANTGYGAAFRRTRCRSACRPG